MIPDHSAEFFLRLQEGNWPMARTALQSLMEGKVTLAALHNLWERVEKLNAAQDNILIEQPLVRVAILGGYTTQPVRLALQVSALTLDRRVQIYEANYNSFRTEILNPASGLYASAPQYVLIATGYESVERFPRVGDSATEVERLVEETIGQWKQLWEAVQRQTGAQILQHNFPLDPERIMGRLENRYPWTRSSFLRALNVRLWQLDGDLIRVVDVADLADRVGQRQWTDLRWRHHSKHGFNPALIGEYAHLLTGTLRAVWGVAKKCLVLDLDNTLWGGVVGDDGVDGIQLGMETSVGEGYHAFCLYLKQLSDRGVLLAVNSRNDPRIAECVFAEHPAMPLKKTDFAAFVCNWESKAANLRTIAGQLNLGVESLVFLDDEPAICAEVRSLVPEVTVLEMSGDPSLFARKLDAMCLFDSLGITEEDALRTRSYSAMAEQREQSAGDLEGFLQGLDLRGTFQQAMPEQLPRIEQLLLKTNQFNLTGGKWNLPQLQELLAEKNRLCVAVQIQDRCANYGLVGAIVGRWHDDALEIENWVLSCRVFSKTVEAFIVNNLAVLATERHGTLIRAALVPTAKNGYARAALEQFGQLESVSPGTLQWSCPVTTSWSTFVQAQVSQGDKS